ncbi:MAG TPA: 50S ribosomal protein L25 [Polyangiaceae bacterium]|jgi:large subunit ribosomal protein L25|nr:50S ribosomal protein L25 [Polyangiaceae bacterium]
MDLRKISASARDGKGKGEAARLRRSGRIPAIAYGKKLAAQSLAVAPEELRSVLTSERGRNTVIELDVDGKNKLTVLLRDYQHHPVSRALLHADFVQIALDEPVDVQIPLEVTGKPVGVVKGGVLRQVFRRIPVRCLPQKIPVKIVHDVTELDLDGHVQAKSLALPEGVEVRLPAEQTVIAIVTEKAAPEEETAAPTAVAGAAGAPAAGAAAGDKAADKGADKAADKGADKKK